MDWPRISRAVSARLGGPRSEMLCSRVRRNGWRRTERAIDLAMWLVYGERGHCARCWREDHRPLVELPDRLRAAGMAVALALAVLPAHGVAQSFTVEDAADQPGAVDVVIVNRWTFGAPDRIVVQTPLGELVLGYAATRNDECEPACPDTVTVLAAPDGMTVAPDVAVVPEDGVLRLRLGPFLGM
jgi:hypothetical protein